MITNLFTVKNNVPVDFSNFHATLQIGRGERNAQMDRQVLEFTIFCIEEIAAKLQVPGNVVYDMLTKQSDILSSYIIPSYDVLHTQSKEYIIDDIISFMQEEGVLP